MYRICIICIVDTWSVLWMLETHRNVTWILENISFLKSCLISYQNDECLSLWWSIKLIMLNFLLPIGIMPRIDELLPFIKLEIWILLNFIFEVYIIRENDDCLSSFDNWTWKWMSCLDIIFVVIKYVVSYFEMINHD